MLFYFGRGGCFSIINVLSRVGAVNGGGGEGLAIVGVMSLALASETESFSKAVSTFGGGEFCDSDGINIHCIGVFLGVMNKG